MKVLHNKPKVFLSHSKADKKFIQSLHLDLQKCQVSPWLDEIDIRHGKPWLDAIFESGIPTCDCILFYLTEESIKSPMVKKEIDASIIQTLKDNKISLLPYVSDNSVRDQLRSDLQALQIPVWNKDNYHELLPSVVAEIWHSYLERTVESATDGEKRRRLELKLELERIKKNDGEIFSSSEVKDFSYIKEQLDYDESAAFVMVDEENTKENKAIRIKVNLLSLVPFISDIKNHTYSISNISQCLEGLFLANSVEKKTYQNFIVIEPPQIDIGEKLLVYGLIERKENPNFSNEVKSVFRSLAEPAFKFFFNAKIERFKYWLTFNNLLPTEVKWSIMEEKQKG